MGTHIMKTTIDITDDLARQAKALARKKGTTFRALVEQGIRKTLEEEGRIQVYQMPDKSVKGQGLNAEFRDKSWSDILNAAYEGRGT